MARVSRIASIRSTISEGLPSVWIYSTEHGMVTAYLSRNGWPEVRQNASWRPRIDFPAFSEPRSISTSPSHRTPSTMAWLVSGCVHSASPVRNCGVFRKVVKRGFAIPNQKSKTSWLRRLRKHRYLNLIWLLVLLLRRKLEILLFQSLNRNL